MRGGRGAGVEGGPGRAGEPGSARGQPAIAAAGAQVREVGQGAIAHPALDQLGLSGIEADHQDGRHGAGVWHGRRAPCASPRRGATARAGPGAGPGRRGLRPRPSRTIYGRQCTEFQQGKTPVMTDRIQAGGLQVAKALHDFINDEALPGTGVTPAGFWAALDAIVHELAPRNRALLGAPRGAAGEDRRLAPRAPRQPARSRGLPRASSSRSAISSPRARPSPRAPPTSIPRSARSPGRSSWCR